MVFPLRPSRVPGLPRATSELSRRRFLGVAGALGVGVAASACAGPGGTDADEEPQGAGETPTGPVEGQVSFAHWRAEDQQVFDTLISEFVAANPDVSVEQDISPSEDYQSTALRRIRGSAVGDVFTAFRGAQFVDMVAAGVWTPFTGQPVLDNFEASLLEPGAQDGEQYGLPYQLVFNMPILNVDALERAGLTEAPQDWEGFLAMCEAFRGLGITPIAWPGADPGNAGQLINSMVMNNAPEPDMFVRIETGEYKATDDWFLRTLEQYAELRPYFQPNATGTGVESVQQLFAQGQAGMLATGSYMMATERELGAEFPFDLIAPITTSAEEAEYEGIYNATFILGVNADTDVAPAAQAFVEFLAQPENASVYANGTGQHLTVADVDYENEDLQATSDWLTRDTLLAPRFQFNDLDIRSAVENACVAVVGGTDPQQAAEAAQAIIDQRVDG